MITRRTFVKFLASAVVAKALLDKAANAEESKRPRFEFNRIKTKLDAQELQMSDTDCMQTGDLFTIEGVNLTRKRDLAQFRITEINSSSCMTVIPI